MTTLRISRAPVLTLWGSVVAERLGWPHETALTLGHTVAGMAAHAKGARPGFCAEPDAGRREPAATRPADATGAIRDVPLLGRIVHVAPTAEGPRAISKNAVVKPEAVETYLHGKFGEQFCAAWTAMERLAASLSNEKLADEALHLYEQFRPVVPPDEQSWGAMGILDLDRIHALARANVQ